ncbi:MAG: hypothetical protein GY836_09065, partial [Herbaspirillum sp.]|uniref:Calx-beta domain-containing protein n=1 Tax=Herbaspirillum sp. TaxID=1890675 RepID=UPI00258D98FA
VPGGERRLDSAAFTVGRGVSVNDVAVLEGDSGSRIAQFAITLSPASASTEATTVDYATADAGATAGDDYQAATGTVSFAPGETAATVDVAILGDLEVEIDELFLLTLGNPTGVLLGDAQGLGTIVDEEGCASPNLLQNPGAEESDPATAVPGWTEVRGAWRRRFGDPVPLAGVASFAVNGGAELIQDVDVSAFAQPIDAATQSFAFAAFLHSPAESAGARLIVELRDLDNATVLDQF